MGSSGRHRDDDDDDEDDEDDDEDDEDDEDEEDDEEEEKMQLAPFPAGSPRKRASDIQRGKGE